MDNDMEMSCVAAAAPKPPEVPPAKEKERWRRVVLVAGLAALTLLAFFVLGRESASTVLEIAGAKLTAMNNGAGFMNSSHGHDAAGNGDANADELLGGLLVPGMERPSCRSRYQMSRYFKHFPYAPSPHLWRKLRAYEARHRRCAPGTPLYAKSVEQLKSGNSSAAAADAMAECSYVVWLPLDGLGNRMLSMVSTFLYALLTGRVLLVALPPDSGDLFCEPFPGATWLLPPDFPVAAEPHPDQSYSKLLEQNEIAVDTANATPPPVPPYVYLSLGPPQLEDGLFFCGEHQLALGKVSWLLLRSDLYFAPSLYAVAELRGELRRLFPAKESVHHLLARYLLHPTNPVWGLVTRFHAAYLAPASRRIIGIQIRMFGFASIPADDMYDQILRCSRQEHILPETDADDAAPPPTAAGGGDNGNNNGSTAIMIASLYGDYYERLRSRYYEHAAANGGGGGGAAVVGVFQPTHEERQATESLAHNQRALAEIYLLSFSDELVTSGLSTFGYVSSGLAGVRPAILRTAFDHKVPEKPCWRAASMEPCNLTPPRGVVCRGEAAGDKNEEMARHVRVCEDTRDGVKFFD